MTTDETIKTNYLYRGDCMELIQSLPSNSIDCAFLDPDYNVGIKYGINNLQSYTTNFDDYIEWYITLAQECHRVLKDTGNIFFINYPKQNSHLRVKYLDNHFYDVQDYSWIYNSNVGHTPRRFTTAHRSVLHCTKSKNNHFYKEQVAVPYQNPNDKRIQKRIADGHTGRMPYSWFYFDLVKNVSREKKNHPCQIPQGLSEMLIKSCTKENDIVLIPFGGSGNEIEVCQRLNRQWIAAELDADYCDNIEKVIRGNSD